MENFQKKYMVVTDVILWNALSELLNVTKAAK